MTIMKRYIALALACVAVAGILSSCGKTQKVEPGETVSVNSEDTGVVPGTSQAEDTDVYTAAPVTTEPFKFVLSDVGGWWKRPDGFVNSSMMSADVMYIDPEAGTWDFYNKYGVVEATYGCRVEDNTLWLECGNIGSFKYTYDGIVIHNVFGGVEFVPGEAISGYTNDIYDGKWYKWGDIDGDYLSISDGAYSYVKADGSVSDTGALYSEERELTVDGTTIREIVVKLSGGSGTKEYSVAEKKTVFFGGVGSEAFINENVIATTDGEDFVRKYDLICNKWESLKGDGEILYFGYHENRFYTEKNVTRDDGTTERVKSIVGTWDIDEYEIMLHYSGGHEEITPYDPEEIRLSYLDTDYKKIS